MEKFCITTAMNVLHFFLNVIYLQKHRLYRQPYQLIVQRLLEIFHFLKELYKKNHQKWTTNKKKRDLFLKTIYLWFNKRRINGLTRLNIEQWTGHTLKFLVNKKFKKSFNWWVTHRKSLSAPQSIFALTLVTSLSYSAM